MSKINKIQFDHTQRFFSPERKTHQTPFGLTLKEKMPSAANGPAGITQHPCPTNHKNNLDVNWDFDWD
jgi:hypothetical protein